VVELHRDLLAADSFGQKPFEANLVNPHPIASRLASGNYGASVDR
jgi:hypothetical protein